MYILLFIPIELIFTILQNLLHLPCTYLHLLILNQSSHIHSTTLFKRIAELICHLWHETISFLINLYILRCTTKIIWFTLSPGVDLSAVQNFPFIGNHIIRLDFEKDIVPKLLFLKDLGVYDHNLGLVLTNNPYILEDPISKLQVQVSLPVSLSDLNICMGNSARGLSTEW